MTKKQLSRAPDPTEPGDEPPPLPWKRVALAKRSVRVRGDVDRASAPLRQAKLQPLDTTACPYCQDEARQSAIHLRPSTTEAAPTSSSKATTSGAWLGYPRIDGWVQTPLWPELGDAPTATSAVPAAGTVARRYRAAYEYRELGPVTNLLRVYGALLAQPGSTAGELAKAIPMDVVEVRRRLNDLHLAQEAKRSDKRRTCSQANNKQYAWHPTEA